MQTSPARATAARANTAKSHDPKTAEGKLASSRNGLKHGLTARTVILDTESEADYQAELDAYRDHFHLKANPSQRGLVPAR